MIDPDFRKRVEAMREQRAQRDKQRDEEDARRDIRIFLDALLPGGRNTQLDHANRRWRVIPSYVFLSFSCGVYLKPNGKVGWRRRWEECYAWPADRKRLIDEVMARRHYCDISICVSEMRTPQRLKGNSVGLWRSIATATATCPTPNSSGRSPTRACSMRSATCPSARVRSTVERPATFTSTCR